MTNGLFKEWRRMLGLVSAAMAFLSIVWWFRSLGYPDEIQLCTVFGRVQLIASVSGDVQWSSWKDYPSNINRRWRTWGTKTQTFAGTIDDEMILIRSAANEDWTSSFRNESANPHIKPLIRYSEQMLKVREVGDRNEMRSEINYTGVGFIFSYWVIVIPLILLASCLLLEKPRNSIQKENSEPILLAKANLSEDPSKYH